MVSPVRKSEGGILEAIRREIGCQSAPIPSLPAWSRRTRGYVSPRALLKSAIIPPYRLPRKALGERWSMEIQPMFMECVAFLCAEHKGRAGGTAFFVEVEEGRKSWTYLVTALHNLHE